jgi:nicotinamide-nucleotide amidase
MSLAHTLEAPLDNLVRHVLDEACERRLTLSTAESCTGGLLASVLTDMPGRSHAFERGFITYTDQAKTEQLGVSPDVLVQHTAVSEPVARAMAEGALQHSRADIAVSVTGYADGSSPGSQAGLVYLAGARRGRPTVTVRQEFGDLGRDHVRNQAVFVGLELFRDLIV